MCLLYVNGLYFVDLTGYCFYAFAKAEIKQLNFFKKIYYFKGVKPYQNYCKSLLTIL
ncbi:hypothetical protein JCM19294_1655 [Nonlabens tegetincola]|uniref:Uncharacterized protein n=1 Tax=Nonlabens tegetincola TaxID=323273 RepID=A0A090Q8H0_9FLAO|nr:hypothetical protein JCM19294_1655 [Nonlabens tegetincola]